MKFAVKALILSPVLLFAQAEPPVTTAPVERPKLTNDQMASIIKQLDAIESQVMKNRTDAFTNALTKFRQAMTSDKDALDLYLACHKLEHFDRKDLKQTDFQNWKDKNEDRLKDPDFLAGIRLQLEYLVLCIQAQDAKDLSTAMPALQAFVPKAVVAVQNTMKHSASGAVEEKDKDKGRGGRQGGGGGQLLGILRQSVKGTDFSKAYSLDDYLKFEPWEYSPLGIAGVYEKVIFPYYLQKKPEELPAQWDARINAELVLSKSVQSETEYQVYYKENQPELNWAKSQYLLKNNVNPIMALAEMLKTVRENPTHTSAAKWLRELREAVAQAQPQAPSPGLTEPEATPAPAAPAGT